MSLNFLVYVTTVNSGLFFLELLGKDPDGNEFQNWLKITQPHEVMKKLGRRFSKGVVGEYVMRSLFCPHQLPLPTETEVPGWRKRLKGTGIAPLPVTGCSRLLLSIDRKSSVIPDSGSISAGYSWARLEERIGTKPISKGAQHWVWETQDLIPPKVFLITPEKVTNTLFS